MLNEVHAVSHIFGERENSIHTNGPTEVFNFGRSIHKIGHKEVSLRQILAVHGQRQPINSDRLCAVDFLTAAV